MPRRLRASRTASCRVLVWCLSGACLVPVGEDFPFSGQVRPSAAAAGRRAGPVLAPLRAAGPAAAHDHDEARRTGGEVLSLVKLTLSLSTPGSIWLRRAEWASVVPTADYVRSANAYGFRPDFREAADPNRRGWSKTSSVTPNAT
jgi:hypothetical protein